MATTAGLISRVRREMADFGEPFQDTFRGDGRQQYFDLTVANVGADLTLTDFSPEGDATVLGEDDYDLDGRGGYLTLSAPLGARHTLIVLGRHYPMFSDEDLKEYVHDAFIQHVSGRMITTRYRDEHGFIKYFDLPMTLDTLPEIEEYLVAILATVEALWALSTDASTDVNIDAPDGTHIDRGQRYAQVLKQIDILTDKYREHCAQLNVGLFRIEMSDLRRVSRNTNRLVPVFRSREYDEHSRPTRILPGRDVRHEDESGVPSPAYQHGPY